MYSWLIVPLLKLPILCQLGR